MFVNIFTRHGEAVARLSLFRFLLLPSQEGGDWSYKGATSLDRKPRVSRGIHHPLPSTQLQTDCPASTSPSLMDAGIRSIHRDGGSPG